MMDASFPCDVLCVQELDLDKLSAPSFLAILRGRGLHVFLSPLDGTMHRCAVLAKLPAPRSVWAAGGLLIPTGHRQRWAFSDHTQVCYDVELSTLDPRP